MDKMTTKINKQSNKKGHNIASDYVGGDKKINNLIGNFFGDNNTANINIYSDVRYRLSREDEAKFKDFVPENKIAEFKNLIERIEFLSELGAYDEAKEFIEQANRIYHNHPVLLTLNGLCEYGTIDKLEVIKNPWMMNRITKLFEKAREVDKGLVDYYGWNSWISRHFFEILEKNIESIKERGYHQHYLAHKNVDYYKAIAKHIIHFENCYKINEETYYLKEFVLHLCGHKGYPWFNINSSGNVLDLGKNIFEGGAEKLLKRIVNQIKIHEENYFPPEIKYGGYFNIPRPKNELDRHGRKIRVISFLAILLALGILMIVSIRPQKPLPVKMDQIGNISDTCSSISPGRIQFDLSPIFPI
jgi:hypothetical protein